MDYAELQVTSNFSFLRGASHPEELVVRAKELGLSALALTDRNSLAGMVRAHQAAKRHGLRLVVGCRLDLTDGTSLLCYPTDRAAYGRLCRLLSLGKTRAPKGECHLTLEDVAGHAAGQIFVVVPPERWSQDDFTARVSAIAGRLGEPCYLAASRLYRGDDRARIARLTHVAEAAGTPLIATGDVHYHDPARRPLQDVVTCIREGCRIHDAGRRLHANAERHLKAPEEMARLFALWPEALRRPGEIVARCNFSLDELRYNYPDEPVPPGKTPQAHLEDLTWDGATKRYPQGIPAKVRAALEKELALIGQLDYAPYFLTVHDIVYWARAQGILCQGRGSAANSAVCYCLYITSVDPAEIDLLFERFISAARNEPPDIDVDFEHERREEVMQYIYRRFGRERAGIAATVITYRARSAIREVAKVMGLTEDVQSALAGTIWGWSEAGIPDEHVREAGLNPADPTLRRAIRLAAELTGFPRHLSQHVGGFVLTQDPLSEVVPIGNAAMKDRTFVEWDKDDLNALGILKIDVLALGMLTCIRKCFDLLERHRGIRRNLASFAPMDDKGTYDMLCRADSLGVFQVESRAQMNMLPRLKPREFYDLVIEVAIVRPGPIQGDMVHPYLRRRDGLEEVSFPAPDPQHGDADELRRVLGKTMGVPIFQEQAMRIAIDAARFSGDEANELRHAMATFRRRGTIETLEAKMVGRMVERGYDPEFARRCFDQIKGFGEYGFPESHAASFALLVYVSSWIKCYEPAVFCCALLNSQPMGFYAPAQIVRDAREHGVELRHVDINRSEWDNILEPSPGSAGGFAVRLGFRQIKGMAEEAAEKIVHHRAEGYDEVEELHARAGLPRTVLERLAAADAFGSLGIDRRQALWRVKALPDTAALPLFLAAAAREAGPETEVILPAMALSEQVVDDYQSLRLSLKAHPMAFLREAFARRGVRPTIDLRDVKNNARVAVAGIVIVRQRPGSAKGVIFMTLEDETGIANAVVWPQAMERYRKVVMGSRLVMVKGRIQRHEDIIHVIAEHLEDCSVDLLGLSENGRDLAPPHARADEVKRPGRDPREHAPAPPPAYQIPAANAARLPPFNPGRHPRSLRDLVPKSRDFH